MRLVTSVLAGVAAVILRVALFTWGMYLFHLDARYHMGHFPLTTLGAIGVVFFAGVRWRYRKPQ